MNKETISNLLGVSVKSVYNYDKENRPIIRLLENYFTNDDLEEFLETNEIKKQELIKDITNDKLKEILKDTHNQKILDEIETLKRKLL